MSRKKISTTIYITPEQDAALKLLSARTYGPVAEYVRQGIDLILKANERKLPGQSAFKVVDPKCSGCGFVRELCICP